MQKETTAQASDSLTLATLLTLAGGFQDAYSYNIRDHVFANAQTGNIVLLGQNLAAGNFLHALRYFLPLAAFFAGVCLSELIKHSCKSGGRIHWRQIILFIEIILLIITGFLPSSLLLNIAANIILSFACAMQVDSFRSFGGISCATTMCIGNMRSATEALCLYRLKGDSEMKYKSIRLWYLILTFAAGAASGAVCSRIIGIHAIWLAAALQASGTFLMFFKAESQPPAAL